MVEGLPVTGRTNRRLSNDGHPLLSHPGELNKFRLTFPSLS